MFEVNDITKKISLHRGNTGDLTISFTGFDFTGTGAKALFSMKRGGVTVKNEVHDIVDNEIVIHFDNADTDGVTPGRYEYDVTVVLNAVFDTSGKLTDGEVVYTTEDPLPAEIRRTVGRV